METISINGKDYNYIVNYTNNEALRMSLNKLTEQTYGFTFENWYKAGYWADNCVPYALTHNNEVVSHITANVIDFVVKGEKRRFVQLGTVMTNENYRNQGLSRILMERVLADWEANSDMVYLFANDDVLEFYPKFGFVPVNEYQLTKPISGKGAAHLVRKMNLDNSDDYNLLLNLAANPYPLAELAMQNNIGLVMFYCKYFDLFTLGENLYYIEDFDAIAVAEYEGSSLILFDIFASKETAIDDVINSLVSENIQDVVLRFTPTDSEGYEMNLYKEEDLTLFVKEDKASLFENNKLIFSTISHT